MESSPSGQQSLIATSSSGPAGGSGADGSGVAVAIRPQLWKAILLAIGVLAAAALVLLAGPVVALWGMFLRHYIISKML